MPNNESKRCSDDCKQQSNNADCENNDMLRYGNVDADDEDVDRADDIEMYLHQQRPEFDIDSAGLQ